MKFDFIKNANNLTVILEGRLDTLTSPDFETFFKENAEGISSVEINCEKLTYISSAGLRVLLAAHKRMSGALTLTNVCELVMEVFEITGFVDVLTIK